MEIELKRKYRTDRQVMGNPAKSRTGNSNGITKQRKKNPKAPTQRQRVMLVDGLSGHRRMVNA